MKRDKKLLNYRHITYIIFAALLAALFFIGAIEGRGRGSASQSLFAMDTYMEVTAYGADSEAAVEAAVAEIRRIDALLSTGSAVSEVAALNRRKTGALSEDTAYLLQRSLELAEDTDGAFDITVYPLVKAWGFAGGGFRVPSDAELSQLLQSVDSSALAYEEGSAWLELPESVEIDFGGIAKGYTSERVSRLMKEYGIQSAILNLGGNVQAVGAKTDKSAWRVAIQNPDKEKPYLGILSVKDQAVITSGGYERYFEEGGIVYHHIIDPHTGKPAQKGLCSVTVVSGDGTYADGLSTALYVLGREKAVEYWRMHKADFDFVFLDEGGMLWVSEGIEADFSSEFAYETIR